MGRIKARGWGWLVLVLVAGVSWAEEEVRPPPAVGGLVEDFGLFDMEGRLWRLGDCGEGVIVLNFWAFWCDTWHKQLGQLKQLARLQEEMGFRLIVVSVDGQWADMQRAHLRRMQAEGDLGFPVLLDGRKVLVGRLGLRRVPTVMVLDKERRVRWVHEAYPGNPAVLGAVRKAATPGDRDR